MKKIACLTILALAFFTSNATIIVKGKRRNVQQNAGITTIECRGSKGDCVRIESATKIATVLNEDGTIHSEWQHDSYDTRVSGQGEELITTVTLQNARKL